MNQIHEEIQRHHYDGRLKVFEIFHGYDISHQTVASILHKLEYSLQGNKKTKEILICADAGGSNSYRSRLWKKKLQEFCDGEKIHISMCYFPPDTSKWNKIEHRLFSFISINWRGKPLLTYQTVINLITSTKKNKLG